VVKKFKASDNIRTFAFTCRQENSLLEISDDHYVCRDAEEKSVAMTRSFSNMLLSYCLMLAKHLDDKDRIKAFRDLCSYMEDRMQLLFGDIKEYIDESDFSSYFSLGSGFNYPLAVEADLKMKEMSQIPSYAYHIFEFNHGPKALLSKDFLVLFFTISKTLSNVDTIAGEVLRSKARAAFVGKEAKKIIRSDSVKFFLDDADFEDELVASFINIPVFHMLAYLKTIKQGLDPDKPRGLDYTTRLDV
jgi:glucosamine--fructose-6-phosphate aminotransferase (isomerizing)